MNRHEEPSHIISLYRQMGLGNNPIRLELTKRIKNIVESDLHKMKGRRKEKSKRLLSLCAGVINENVADAYIQANIATLYGDIFHISYFINSENAKRPRNTNKHKLLDDKLKESIKLNPGYTWTQHADWLAGEQVIEDYHEEDEEIISFDEDGNVNKPITIKRFKNKISEFKQ